MKVQNVVKKYNETSLILRIVIGLIIGVILGLLIPGIPVFSIFGDVFVNSLKAIAPILVFVLVIASLAGGTGGLDSRFGYVIFLYLFSTLMAGIVAVIASFMFPVTVKLVGTADISSAPTGIRLVLEHLIISMVSNPVEALASANYIGILFWAVLLGLILKKVAKEGTKQMIADIEDLKKRYAIPRKTVIRDLGEVEVKKEVEEEVDYVVLLDRFFYLKAVPKPIFEKNKDIPYKLAVECTNLDRLAVFDSDGQMHTLKVAELIKKQMKKDKKFRISDKGIQIFEFCQMQENADVLSVLTEKQLAEGEMIIAAADGKGKRVAGSAFPTSRKTSQASKKPLIFAAPAEQFLVIVSEAGNVLKIRTADIPEQGKGAGGVTLISLKKGDSIRMMETGGKDSVIGGVAYADINTGIRGGRGSRIKLEFPEEQA